MRSRDEILLDRFFSASRVYDRAAVAGVATVVFNPKTDGIVQDYAVIQSAVTNSGSSDDRHTLTIRAQVRKGGLVSPQDFRVTIENRDGRWLITRLTGEG